MTTQSEMKVIVKNLINELGRMEDHMSRYNKLKIDTINWGTTQFAAYEFLQSVKEEIKKLNNLLSVYTRPDLQHIYANRNYDDSVNELRKNFKVKQKIYDNFVKYEYSPHYFPLSKKDLNDD